MRGDGARKEAESRKLFASAWLAANKRPFLLLSLYFCLLLLRWGFQPTFCTFRDHDVVNIEMVKQQQNSGQRKVCSALFQTF